MRVAIVNETVPYPPTAGNRIRTLNLMQRLAKEHQITYICRAADRPTETQEAVEYLKQQGIRTIIADGPAEAKKGASFYTRLAANVISPLPYAVASHRSRALRQRIAEMARSGEFDLWQFEWLAYAPEVACIPGARTLLVAHNVESLIWKRYCQTEPSLGRKLYLQQQYLKYRRYQRRVMQAVSGVVCVSEEDAALARGEFKPQQVWVVDNGVDRGYFEAAKAERVPGRILFLGSLEWRPNLDAVKLLLERIFPAVRQRRPDCRLLIVGRRPPEWLRSAVASAPGVELHADVPDVRQYLSTAAVMAVPLRVGGGSRLKILESLACGLPVVSSRVGAEGLELKADEQIRIAEGEEQFAEQLLWVLDNAQAAARMAESARQKVYARYDWDVLAARLDTIWRKLKSTTVMEAESSANAQPALG